MSREKYQQRIFDALASANGLFSRLLPGGSSASNAGGRVEYLELFMTEQEYADHIRQVALARVEFFQIVTRDWLSQWPPNARIAIETAIWEAWKKAKGLAK